MQLNISHEVTTTETKTVDVELPYYSRKGDYYFCITPEEAILKVFNRPGYSSFLYVDKTCASTTTYQQELSQAATGELVSRPMFEQQFDILLNSYPL